MQGGLSFHQLQESDIADDVNFQEYGTVPILDVDNLIDENDRVSRKLSDKNCENNYE